MGCSVLSVSSRALVEACGRLGLDTGRILRAAQIDAATLQDADARIPVGQADALWRKAYELSNDPDLALHAIEALPFGAYRVIDYLGSSAATLGDALAKVSAYFPLVNDVVRLPYEVGERHVSFAIEASSQPRLVTRPYAEYTLAAVFLRTRAAANLRFPLIRVEFTHDRPADVREHERIFECPVVFGAANSRLLMARAVWDMPCPGSDPSLSSVLEMHARMLLDRLPAPIDLVARVLGAIERELSGGSPGLASIARQLAMSPRTLQRRLRDEGVPFNEVLDAVRFRAARCYLARRDVAAAEVAYLLGFAGQGSFNRAFRRWSGETPSEYRRRSSAVQN